MHEVMDAIGSLADEERRGLLTMHTLAGDPQAFAEIVEQDGFAACLHEPI